MERKIYLNMCALALLTILLTSAITLWAYYGFFTVQAQEALKTEAEMAAISLNGTDHKEELVKSFDLGGASSRITLVDKAGKVLFDSQFHPAKMDNHGNRREISQALTAGRGEATRFSKTLNQKTYYYAIRLNDGKVVRLAVTTSTALPYFFKTLPYLFYIGIFVFALCALLAYSLTQKIVKPLYSINLENPQDDHGYDELAPLLLRIKEQNRLIEAQINSLASERDTINTIISNMQEGLVLLDKDNKVLAVNKSATRLLRVPPAGYLGENFLVMTRSLALGEAAEKALEGLHNDGMIAFNGREYHYFASPVYENNQVDGAVLLLFDATEEQRAQRLRQEFSANVSHELKTPLTSISGYAEIIESGMAGEADVQSFAGKIKSEASRLVSLIDDIIKLSQLDEAAMEESLAKVDLLLCAKNAAARLQRKAEEHQVKMILDGQNALVKGVENMLEELVFNLLDNAIKYNKPGGTVHINISSFEDRVRLTVVDTGIGIPEEDLARVFERFYRVDKSHSKKIGGTGLGLAIVKHIAQHHNATLEVNSIEKEGTTVAVDFPQVALKSPRVTL